MSSMLVKFCHAWPKEEDLSNPLYRPLPKDKDKALGSLGFRL